MNLSCSTVMTSVFKQKKTLHSSWRLGLFSIAFGMMSLLPVLWSNTVHAQTTADIVDSKGNKLGTVSVPASKIGCDPKIRQAIINAALTAQAVDAAANRQVEGHINDQPQNADQLMSCVGSFWPNLNIGFPTMDQITKAAKDYVVNKACTEARQQLSNVTAPITSMGGMWGSIPGLNVPSTGGSVGSGGSNGSCVIINGQQHCTGSPTSGGLPGVL